MHRNNWREQALALFTKRAQAFIANYSWLGHLLRPRTPFQKEKKPSYETESRKPLQANARETLLPGRVPVVSPAQEDVDEKADSH